MDFCTRRSSTNHRLVVILKRFNVDQPRDPKGTHTGGRWTKSPSISSPSPLGQPLLPIPSPALPVIPLPARLIRIIHTAESQIWNRKIEYGVVLGIDGTHIHSAAGEPAKVSLRGMQIEQLEGSVVTHNHPHVYHNHDACQSFSPNDIGFAIKNGLSAIRVVGYGREYMMEVAAVPPWLRESLATRTMEIAVMFAKALAEVRDERHGTSSIDEKMVDYWHNVWQASARVFPHLRYSWVDRPDRKAAQVEKAATASIVRQNAHATREPLEIDDRGLQDLSIVKRSNPFPLIRRFCRLWSELDAVNKELSGVHDEEAQAAGSEPVDELSKSVPSGRFVLMLKAFDPNQPRVPKGKKGAGQWVVRRSRENMEVKVPVPNETFERVGVAPGNVFANYHQIYRKHTECFKTPDDAKRHVEFVLDNPAHILRASHGQYTLLIRSNGEHRAAVVEFVLRGGKYRVRTAYIMDESQLRGKLAKELSKGLWLDGRQFIKLLREGDQTIEIPNRAAGVSSNTLSTKANSSIGRRILIVKAPPSQGQIEAGNYKMDHLRLHGLDITIENPAGSIRSGVDAKGNAWSVKMRDDYGYIRGAKHIGADGDPVDVFIGPHPESEVVFIIDQNNPRTGRFDEHKCVIGARNAAEAREVYERNYSAGWMGFDACTALTVAQFKEWLKRGGAKKAATKARVVVVVKGLRTYTAPVEYFDYRTAS